MQQMSYLIITLSCQVSNALLLRGLTKTKFTIWFTNWWKLL